MSDMKCPFCQQELKCWDEPHNAIYSNWSFPNCRRFAYGNKLIWQELIRTRKALDVAKEGLKHYCTDSDNWSCVIDFTGDYDNAPSEFADKALEQITALEQKD